MLTFNFYILDAGYRLESFSTHQEIKKRKVSHSEYFTIGNDSYIALTRTGSLYTHCADSVLVKWDKNMNRFIDYQTIPSAGGRQMKFFRTPWDGESYLFVINAANGCPNVLGKRWFLTFIIKLFSDTQMKHFCQKHCTLVQFFRTFSGWVLDL